MKLVGIAASNGDLTDWDIAAAHQLRGFRQAYSNEELLGWTAHILLKQLTEIAAVQAAGIGHLLYSEIALIVLLNIPPGLL